jgi:hypothetical protein
MDPAGFRDLKELEFRLNQSLDRRAETDNHTRVDRPAEAIVKRPGFSAALMRVAALG